MLVISLGLHWALIQGVAWLGMVVSYSCEDGSVSSGVAKTLSGEYPCELCKMVEKGLDEQQKKNPPNAPPPEAKPLVYLVDEARVVLAQRDEFPEETSVHWRRHSVRAVSSLTLEPEKAPPQRGAA